MFAARAFYIASELQVFLSLSAARGRVVLACEAEVFAREPVLSRRDEMQFFRAGGLKTEGFYIFKSCPRFYPSFAPSERVYSTFHSLFLSE